MVKHKEQRLTGITMAAIGVIMPLLLNGDITFSIFALSSGITLLFTEEILKKKEKIEVLTYTIYPYTVIAICTYH